VKKYLSSLLIVGVLLSGCGAGKVYNVSKPALEKKYTKKQMKNAIVAALQRFKWKIVQESSSKIIAKYSRGKIMAKIALTYTENSYEINYVDSKNLKYNGVKIHKNYNGWIYNLEQEIDNNLRKIAAGQSLKVSAYTAAQIDTSAADKASSSVAQTEKERGFSCKKSFNFTGSLWKGRVITAKQSINNISKEQAVTQAASVLSTEGFIVDTTSPNVGLISAHEVKSNGKTLPINLMFSEDDKSGVVAKLTISVPAGESFSVGSMKNYMCDSVMGKIKSTGYVKVKKEQASNKAAVAAPAKKDVPTRLKELKKLYEDKLITKKEYDAKRVKVLEEL